MSVKLLEQILSNANMNRAYERVVSNKGIGGVDGMSTSELLNYLKDNGEVIRRQIRERKYKPQPV